MGTQHAVVPVRDAIGAADLSQVPRAVHYDLAFYSLKAGELATVDRHALRLTFPLVFSDNGFLMLEVVGAHHAFVGVSDAVGATHLIQDPRAGHHDCAILRRNRSVPTAVRRLICLLAFPIVLFAHTGPMLRVVSAQRTLAGVRDAVCAADLSQDKRTGGQDLAILSSARGVLTTVHLTANGDS